MRKKLKLVFIMAALFVSVKTFAQENEDTDDGDDTTDAVEEAISDRYKSSDLLTRSLEAYPGCINYCVTKLEIRLEYTGTSVNVYVVPVIAHNNPDMLVMSSRNLGKGAYIDWEDLTGELQAEIRQLEMSTITGLAVEAFTGQTQYANFGKHQAVVIQETQIVGNPAAYVSQYYGREAYDILNQDGSPDGGEYGDMISQYSEVSATGSSLDTEEIYQEALNYYDEELGELNQTFQQAQDAAKLIADAQASAAGFGGATFEQDAYMCASEVTPFWPYYLSSVDAIAWRGQYPFVDGTHTGRFFSLENQVRPTGSTILSDWGWIYPRTGFLNNDHPGRTATVLSKRAAAVAGDADVKGRYRIETPNSATHQKMSPNVTDACEFNIADLDSEIEADDAYSYNLWVRYECSTSSRGVLATTIDIPDICID